MEISYNTISNSEVEKLETPVQEEYYSSEESLPKQPIASGVGERKYSKRRKVDTMKNRFTKPQISDGTTTKALETQPNPDDRQKLPPISAKDQLVTGSSHSASSTMPKP